MVHKGHAANKKEPLQINKKRGQWKRTAANEKGPLPIRQWVAANKNESLQLLSMQARVYGSTYLKTIGFPRNAMRI